MLIPLKIYIQLCINLSLLKKAPKPVDFETAKFVSAKSCKQTSWVSKIVPLLLDPSSQDVLISFRRKDIEQTASFHNHNWS